MSLNFRGPHQILKNKLACSSGQEPYTQPNWRFLTLGGSFKLTFVLPIINYSTVGRQILRSFLTGRRLLIVENP